MRRTHAMSTLAVAKAETAALATDTARSVPRPSRSGFVSSPGTKNGGNEPRRDKTGRSGSVLRAFVLMIACVLAVQVCGENCLSRQVFSQQSSASTPRHTSPALALRNVNGSLVVRGQNRATVCVVVLRAQG